MELIIFDYESKNWLLPLLPANLKLTKGGAKKKNSFSLILSLFMVEGIVWDWKMYDKGAETLREF